MAGVIATIPKFQFSANGVPMVGGTLETYIAGSTTPATTWQDSALTIANTNPISLDARGECVLWLDSTKSYKFVLKNASGVIQWTQDNISGAGSLADKLRTDLAASTGAGLVGFQQAGTGAVPTTVQSKLRETVSVKDFGAVGDGVTDDTAAIQAAVNAGVNVFFPSTAPNYYKITTAITVPAGAHLYGAQQSKTIIGAWACNAFLINGASGDNVTIEYMELRNYTAGGVIDAKANIGVYCQGTNANHVNYFTANKLYIRGFSNGIQWDYTWNSLINDVTTINIGAEAVKLFGQSVNNAISNSRLGANGGNSSIRTVKDVAVKGEGLMVSNCLLAEGTYGIQSDGFLSLDVSACTIDLIASIGIDLTNCPAFSISNSWVYAALYGIHFQALGSPVDQGAAVTGCYITVTGTTASKAIYFEANNQGLSVIGGELICDANGRLVHVDGSGVAVTGVRGVNSGTNPSVFFNGADCLSRNNTGSMVVQWNVGVPSQGGVAVATAAFAGATGAQSLANGCSVVRNAVGDYTVTFAYPLISANYVPIVTLDRGGNGAMGYAITSQLVGSFRFTVTNSSATAQDPTNVWVAVFN